MFRIRRVYDDITTSNQQAIEQVQDILRAQFPTLYERVREEALDFEIIGRMIGSLGIPILVVQEGGYDTRVLGINACSFFTGLWGGAYSPK